MSSELDEVEIATRFGAMTERLQQSDATIELLTESIAELELATDSVGWRRIATVGALEFTDEGLRRIATVCQLVALKNPLLRRALYLRAAYTWAQGVEIKAVDPRVDKVVQEFLADEGNQEALFSPAAQVGRDVSSGTDGNLFIACFTSPISGDVKVRTVPFLEIGRIIRNGQDRADPWFYRHDSIVSDLDEDGNITDRPVSVWHPALGSHPDRPRLPKIEGWPVLWDAPMLHMAEERPDGWVYGVPPAYAAVDWALAYKDFLSDWATYMKALSRFAWRQTGPGRKQAAARAAVAAPPSLDPTTGEPFSSGATAFLGPDQRLEAIPKTGATIDAKSGDPLANMVAAAVGIPITALLGDPSRGDRSAADNLDRPTELGMQLHQAWWKAGYLRILTHVIDSAALATVGPAGRLRGKVTKKRDGRTSVVLANGRDRTVRITFPDLDDITPAALIDAIVKADQSGKVHPFIVLRLLLQALGVPDVDEAIALVTGPDGEFKAPKGAGPPVPAVMGGGPSPSANPNDPAPDHPNAVPSPTKTANTAVQKAKGQSLPAAG